MVSALSETCSFSPIAGGEQDLRTIFVETERCPGGVSEACSCTSSAADAGKRDGIGEKRRRS
jgi:hypothetical protein